MEGVTMRAARPRAVIALSVVIAAFAPAQTASAGHAAFTVDTKLDEIDVAPGDGLCETASGDCSLRAAVMEANEHAGHDTIIVPVGTYALTISGTDDDFDAFVNGAGENPSQWAAEGDLDILRD